MKNSKYFLIIVFVLIFLSSFSTVLAVTTRLVADNSALTNATNYLASNDSTNGFFNFTSSKSVSFSGGDYFIFKDVNDSTFENYLKIEVVAKTGNLSDDGVLVYKRDEENTIFFELRFNVDGALSFLVGDMDYVTTMETLKTFNDNSFHKIDVILTKKNAFIFVDGVLEAQINDIYRIKNFYNAGNLVIGANLQDVKYGMEQHGGIELNLQ